MTLRKRILKYLRENPKSTADEIAEGLRINYKTVTGALSGLKRKGEIEAADSWPRRFSVAEGDPANREYDKLKVENNRLRAQLDDCQKKLVRLPRRVLKQNT